MNNPHDAARRWIENAIAEEHPRYTAEACAAVARALHSIATDFEVPVEELVAWIHTRTDGDRSTHAWRDHCIHYSRLRKRLCESPK